MPSFSMMTAFRRIGAVISRFPLAILIALVGTVTGILLAHEVDQDIVPRLLMVLSLGFPLSILGTVIAERQSRYRLIAPVIVLGVMAAYALLLRGFSIEPLWSAWIIQHFLWLAVATLLVVVAPFITTGATTALRMWAYAMQLMYAAVKTVVYAGIIYAGISVALAAIGFLFDLTIDPLRWVEIWMVMVGVFSPIFFLAQYPSSTTQIAAETYPRELRRLALYVLAPLVGLYLLILYAYTLKIVLLWQWPDGTVASLILGFSLLGLITYALVYPLTQREERLRRASRFFFLLLIPQAIVMVCAVGVRVSAYGITEKRYLLGVFALWLLGIAVTFLVARVKDLRLLPMSLLVVTFLSSFGPWGVFAVSERSQVQRLETLLRTHTILQGDRIVPTTVVLPAADAQQISNIVTYLHDTHGLKAIGSWLTARDTPLDCVADGYRCITPEMATAAFGVPYVASYGDPDMRTDELFLTLDTKSPPIDIGGYRYLIPTWQDTVLDGATYTFAYNQDAVAYEVTRNGTLLSSFSLKDKLDSLATIYRETGRSTFSADEMSIPVEDNSLRIKLYFSSVSGTDAYWISGETVLVSFK